MNLWTCVLQWHLLETFWRVDEVLRGLWFQYVPKKMREHEFWRRYFIAVKRLRQEVIDSDTDNSVGRSWSSIERRLTYGGIGNESIRKDPLEEEAYKEAVPPSMIFKVGIINAPL